ENRLRILMALRNRELCVCQVTAMLDLAPSTTSKHLSVLRQARLIESAKHGKWVYYRLAEAQAENNRIGRMVKDALDLMRGNLAGHPAILRDEKRFAEILKQEDILCAGLDESEKNCMHSLEIHSLVQLEQEKE
ncbi:MAG: metalloregulator ArsR/SmtB family transcription factor, partial [Deltaproteobacteria bacterium]|nr:metalloregulator ArsR/SmtB family transcription factor [Deltaproteobacteria bacterium]